MMFSFLLAMAWKSALVSALALALAYALRRHAASDRLIPLRAGVAMLLALPLVMMFLPALEIQAFAAPPPVPIVDPMLALPDVGPVTADLPAPVDPSFSIDPSILVGLIYLSGLALLGLWQLAGLALLRRWTARASAVTCPVWLRGLEAIEPRKRASVGIMLLVSDDVKAPLSWGWRRPVILIDRATLDRPDDAEAILVHEGAHIARRDWPALMCARAARILFWFNPLVWLLEREVVQQSEEAADFEAANRVGAACYAETLLGWARFHALVPANSIAPAPSALGRRVRSILDMSLGQQRVRGASPLVATLLCIGIATPIAATQLVAASAPPAAPSAPYAPVASDASEPAISLAAPPASPSALAPMAPLAPTAPEADSSGRDHPDHYWPPVPPIPAVPPVPPVPDVDAIVADALADIPNIEVETARAVDRAEIRAAMREARKAVARSQTEVALAMKQMREDLPRTIARSMASGAAGMEQGAAGMETGAAKMEREGERLRTDRAYREREIERARAHGETVTHEQLIEAGEGMQEGAEGMRDGAREMRESAAEMRAGGTD